MTLMIAGERSGVGKTTLTLAILAYLKKQGLAVQSFKVGPDYIDAMFHRDVTGRPCRNLDPVLTSESYVRRCFRQHTQTVSYSLVEGVMGLFDGAAPEIQQARNQASPNDSVIWGSTAHVARLLQIPVVLVVDCSRFSYSVAALVQGYRTFDPQLKLAGVLLNRVGSDRHRAMLKAALEPLNLPILGILERQSQITIPDRHLGLVPTNELSNWQNLLEHLTNLAATSFDWERLLPLFQVEERQQKSSVQQDFPFPSREKPSVSPLERCVTPTQAGERWAYPIPTADQGLRGVETGSANLSLPDNAPKAVDRSFSSAPVKVAIAWDAAFNFYYADNFDLLQELGATLVFWSPLRDAHLPEGVQGLYLGGGFPEMFAAQLGANSAARQAVKTKILAGMPTYAECGGLMYLCQQITTFEGQCFPMVGVLPTEARMGQRLTLGYRRAIAQRHSPSVRRGQPVWGHEFHRSYLTRPPSTPVLAWEGIGMESRDILSPLDSAFDASLQGEASSSQNGDSEVAPPPLDQAWNLPNLHASYLHLHWGATPEIAQRFLDCCRQFQGESLLGP